MFFMCHAWTNSLITWYWHRIGMHEKWYWYDHSNNLSCNYARSCLAYPEGTGNGMGYWSQLCFTTIKFSVKFRHHLTINSFQHPIRCVRWKITWKSKTENVARPCRDVLSPLSCNTCTTSSLKILKHGKLPEEKKYR
jgi:hypothetical protein